MEQDEVWHKAGRDLSKLLSRPNEHPRLRVLVDLWTGYMKIEDCVLLLKMERRELLEMIKTSVRYIGERPGARFELSSDETLVRAAWRPWQQVPLRLLKRRYPRSPERSLRHAPQAASSMGPLQPQHRQQGTPESPEIRQDALRNQQYDPNWHLAGGPRMSDLTWNLDGESLWDMTIQERERVLRSDLKKKLDEFFERAPHPDALPYRLYGCIDSILSEYTHTQILDIIHDGLVLDVVWRIDQEQAKPEREPSLGQKFSALLEMAGRRSYKPPIEDILRDAIDITEEYTDPPIDLLDIRVPLQHFLEHVQRTTLQEKIELASWAFTQSQRCNNSCRGCAVCDGATPWEPGQPFWIPHCKHCNLFVVDHHVECCPHRIVRCKTCGVELQKREEEAHHPVCPRITRRIS